MVNKRDNFSEPTKKLLADRVGYRCSNPYCRKLTRGPNDNPDKSTNIGVASHICAATPGGPRYDDNMTPAERKSLNNGIWLCQNCSKLIDTDITKYSIEALFSWKKAAEKSASLELETASYTHSMEQDKEIIKFLARCLDRPAFQDHIYQEGRMEDFEKAIEDTIIAINTGVLKSRDGSLITQFEGKSTIQNPIWREKLEVIYNKLVLIRRRLKRAEAEKAYTVHGTGEDVFYCFCDKEVGEWFNTTREELLKEFSSILKEVGLHELHFPRRHYHW